MKTSTSAKKSKTYSASKIRKLTVTAILAAVSSILIFVNFPIPGLMPGFIKMDISDFPALIATFALGPMSGVGVCLIKNLLNICLGFSDTGGVGELSNFILGCMLVIPAGLIYKKHKTRKFAVLGALTGALCMAFMSLLTNYYIVYPIYTNFMPMDAIIGAYQAILPKVHNLWQALLIFNVPFTFVKGSLCTLVTFLLYKHLSPILKGKK